MEVIFQYANNIYCFGMCIKNINLILLYTINICTGKSGKEKTEFLEIPGSFQGEKIRKEPPMSFYDMRGSFPDSFQNL